MTHDELDRYALSILENNKNVLFEWATGCGKTKQAIKAIDLLDKDKPNNVLIVVAETAHKKNWIEEFERWNKELLTNINYSINLVCYDSLHHFKGEKFDLVILDEAHHIWTEIRTAILTEIVSDRFILLSATMDDEVIEDIRSIIGDICVSVITLDEAIKGKLLPEPKVFLIPLILDNKINNQTIEEVRGDKDKLVTIHCSVAEKWKYLKDKKRYPNLRLIISCTERQKYNDLDLKIEYYKRLCMYKKNPALKNKLLQYGSQRKNFLGQIKTDKARKIISSFGQSRFICFCTDIEQADVLGGNNSIHHKKGNSLEIIDKFNKHIINSLYVVGMLKEGQNLDSIEKGLIIQLDGKSRPFIQKLGRVLRAEYPEIYIMYFAGTQDEVFLRNTVLKGLDEKFIHVYENND